MDGIHDLGGRQGFGPIDVDDDERPFHAAWEGREWAIAQCARVPGITVDWWRHCRELILPDDYLTRPYFDSWAQTNFATYIEAGLITLDEVDAGHALDSADARPEPPPVRPSFSAAARSAGVDSASWRARTAMPTVSRTSSLARSTTSGGRVSTDKALAKAASCWVSAVMASPPSNGSIPLRAA